MAELVDSGFMEPMAGLEKLNQLPAQEARDTFARCCGSSTWADRMTQQRPYQSEKQLQATASRLWNELKPQDWLEAFAHHPRIGDTTSLKEKFADTAHWAKQEQKGIQDAPDDIIQALFSGNQDYEQKFGFIFLVCATGKSAKEMLGLLKARMQNDRETELTIAAGEQEKITQIRLEKMIHP